jgi:hypothetical protein
MNYKLQLSSHSNTAEADTDGLFFESWGVPAAKWQDAEWTDAKIFRSWLLHDRFDPEARFGLMDHHINWSAVLGIGFATILSVGIWAGIGFVIARIW